MSMIDSTDSQPVSREKTAMAKPNLADTWFKPIIAADAPTITKQKAAVIASKTEKTVFVLFILIILK
jgi:hypothetical protein